MAAHILITVFHSIFYVDWSEGSKDGFPGNIGTVIRQDDGGYVKCIFDGESAEVPSLRMGVRARNIFSIFFYNEGKGLLL